MVTCVIRLDALKLAPYNPRTHPDKFLETLRKSMEEDGYVEPIVYNKRTNHIISGHARFKVLQKAGIKEAEVVQVDIDETKEKALNVKLNKIRGEWDKDKLIMLMDEIIDKGVALEDVGFEPFEFEELRLATGHLDDPSRIGGTRKEGTGYVYTIVFNNQEEREKWEEYIRTVKNMYHKETISENIIADIEERGMTDGKSSEDTSR